MAELSSLGGKNGGYNGTAAQPSHSRERGGDVRTAAIQLAAAKPGRKITVISFPFLRRWPPRAKQKCFQALSSQAGREEGACGSSCFSLRPRAQLGEQGALSSHAVRLKTLAATGESCQAFSGIDPARLWLAGSQKTKYFLLLRLGKEI